MKQGITEDEAQSLVDLLVPATHVAVLDAPADDPVSTDEAEPSSTDTDLTHVVTRTFHGAGLDRVIGEVVAASSWRMADVLVEERRLRPLTRKDPEPVPDGQGRFFIDDDSLLAYIDSIIPASAQEG